MRAARHGWRWSAVLVAATLAGTAANLAYPAVFGAAVDGQLGTGGAGADGAGGSARPVLWLAFVLAVLAGTEALNQLAAPSVTASATAWLRRGLLRQVLALGVPGRDRFAAGDLVSRLTSDTAATGGIAPALARSFSQVTLSAGGVVALALIDVRLAVTFLLGVPAGILIVTVFVRRASRLATDYLRVHGAIATRLLDALAGIRTIRASGTVDREVQRALAPAGELTASGRAMWDAYGRVSWQGMLLVPLLEVAVLAVAGYGVAAGRLTPGQLLAALAYAGLGLAFFGQAGVLMRLAWARAGARRLTEVHAAPALPEGTDDLPPGPGELVLRGVTVGGVLDGLDLTVPAGRSVAVVGRSGAGKSTLAAVAGRLTDPDRGDVLLDGVALRDLTPDALRREVGYAFERPVLIGDTVSAAVAFGRTVASPAEVEHAVRVASAEDFVRRLPDSYDTALAATPMSGGEVQRLGLARAVAHAGRLVILDDATSSLDTVTEARVGRALAEAFAGRTRLVVAHRAATAARADLVAWLDGGRVRALAPHREMWDDPAYRAVFGGER